MSDVVEACHHGRISSKEVRRRLRGANRVCAYITSSRLKKFILSFFTDKEKGSVKYLYVPNIKGFWQSQLTVKTQALNAQIQLEKPSF